MDVHELLLKVQNHEVDLASAEEYLKKLPYEDLGFAKLDHHRRCAPGLARSFTVPERRRSIWYGYSRALRNERAMFSERGQQRNSLRLSGKCFLRPCMRNFHGQSIFSIMCRSWKAVLRSAPEELQIFRWQKKRRGRQNFSAVM